MCIRDSYGAVVCIESRIGGHASGIEMPIDAGAQVERFGVCLLYTSDAADERSSVDLGGRRIIKKKKQETVGEMERNEKHRMRSNQTE